MATIGDKVIVRSDTAGCFYGELETAPGAAVTLLNARRLWYIEGAATLSQLAVDGTNSPETCKVPVAVSRIYIASVAEILDTTTDAQTSIESIAVWSA